MSNPIIRDAHPAAPLTPQTEPHYRAYRRIKRKLAKATDTSERIRLVGELGRITQTIWMESRRERTV